MVYEEGPGETRRDLRPLYVRAQDALTHLLAKGGYRPGDKLPPEPELAKQLGVSRATLREVLRALESQGIIVRRRGVGTFVNVPPITVEGGLEVLESLDEIMRRRNKVVRTRDLFIRQEAALPKAAARLQIEEGEPVIVISRTRLVDDIPVAWMLDVLPTSVISLEEVKLEFQGSVLDMLRRRGKPLIAYAYTNVLAVDADADLAHALGVSERRSLLFLEQILYDERSVPVVYERHYYVPGLVRFHVIRK